MQLRRIRRGLVGRAYEAALRLGLVRYRRPFRYYNQEVWNQGYGVGEHDHYEGIADRPRYGAIVSYLRAHGGALDILDIGCGTGVLRERIPDDMLRHFTGVDTAPNAIARAQGRCFINSTFRVSGIPEDGAFDAIVCNEMLYLVEDLDGFLDKARSLLKEGGLFVTSNTRFHGDFHLRRQIEKRFKKLDESIIMNPIYKRKWRIGCYVGPAQSPGMAA